jgi:dTDP-4-dehydrorhamnose reductase
VRLLVIGRTGQLATALAGAGDATCVGREIYDLARSDTKQTLDLLRRHRPDAIVNAAAYTAVDAAENDGDAAFALNATGPRVLAEACLEYGTPLVHVSTDYVFDGLKSEPYTETDPLNPQSIYGASKAAGEMAILESGARSSIVRTSWVFAAAGQNFVRTMLRLAQTRDEIGVVVDQRGRPTWVSDLAGACRALAERLIENDRAAEGIFHFANEEEASWADLAAAVFEEARARGWKAASVKRITTSEFPTLAQRPKNSRLDTSKFASLFAKPRPWRNALTLCMDEMSPP